MFPVGNPKVKSICESNLWCRGDVVFGYDKLNSLETTVLDATFRSCVRGLWFFFLAKKILCVAIFSRWRFPKREFRRTSVVHLRVDIPEDSRPQDIFRGGRLRNAMTYPRLFFHIPFSFKVIKITAMLHLSDTWPWLEEEKVPEGM